MAKPKLTLEEAKRIMLDVQPTLSSEVFSRINPGLTQLQMWHLLMRSVASAEQGGDASKTPLWNIIAKNIWNEFGKPETAYSRLKQENAQLRMRIAELEAVLADKKEG